MKMEYRKRLNPERSLRTPKGIKGTRQKVIVTHNPREVDQAQELLVRFPNLGSNDIIISEMANLSFNIELTSAVDANRTLVSNIVHIPNFEGVEGSEDFSCATLPTIPLDFQGKI